MVMRVAGATPRTAPPTGGDWIPVSLDGAWCWDGQSWGRTAASPWVSAPADHATAIDIVVPRRSARDALVGAAAGLTARMIVFAVAVGAAMAIAFWTAGH